MTGAIGLMGKRALRAILCIIKRGIGLVGISEVPRH